MRICFYILINANGQVHDSKIFQGDNMSNTMKWILGIVILAIITLFMSLVWPYQGLQNSKNMGEDIQTQLNENGMAWATVEMKGNVANISGEAPSEAAKNEALKVAQATECTTCKKKDKANKTWHEARDAGMDVKRAPIVSPYVFTGVRSEDGSIVLDGYVRNVAERDSVMAEAKKLYGDRVTDRKIKIAAGEPNADWRNVISRNLTELSTLEYGQFDMTDKTSVITGLASSEAVRNSLVSNYGALPSPYSGSASVQVPNAPARQIVDVDVCQNMLNDLKRDNKVNFAYNRAEITGAPSFELLNSVASAAKQCSSFQITVGGHTDSDGSDAYNQSLSEARAKSVVAYLINEQNIPASRLTAVGYGEVAPIASNDTSAGKAANRRIEFTITRSE